MNNALPYIVLITIYGCLALLYHFSDERKIRGLIQTSSILLFLFFFGLRGFIFYDWFTYFDWFNFLDVNISDINEISGSDSSKFIEPLFYLLGICCKAIYNNYHFFVFVCTGLNTFLIIRFFVRNGIYNLPLALLIFISLNGIYFSTDLMRSSTAILIFANSLEYIRDKKPLKYFLLCLIACGFHISSIIYFPLYFFINRKISKWIYVIIFLASNVIYISSFSFFEWFFSLVERVMPDWAASSISWYLKTGKSQDSILTTGYLERLITGTLVFCFIDKLRTLRKDADIYINSILIFIAIFLCFSDSRIISTRLAYMFNYAYWIIWIDLISCFEIRNNRKLFTAFIYIYCFAKILSIGQDPFSHYENILFRHSSYQEKELFFRKHFNDNK